MTRDVPPPQPPSSVRDADRTRPGLWRWMAFWTLALFVVSLWVPVVPDEPPAEGSTAATLTAFTVDNLALLGVLVALAAWVLPAPWRVRLLIAALLVGTTLLAWLLEGPIRDLLGGPYDTRPPDSAGL